MAKNSELAEKFKSANVLPYCRQVDSDRSLSAEMIRFAHHKEARTIPQFLALKEIGWSTLHNFMEESHYLKNSFQTMASILWCKWFDFAMETKRLPAHQAKIVEKYLNIYDGHSWEVSNAKAKEIAVAQASAPRHYVVEDYQKAELQAPYKEIYDENASRREKERPQPVVDRPSSRRPEAESVDRNGNEPPVA